MSSRANVVRLYPNKEQCRLLSQAVGSRRWVYNWGLSRWKELFENNKTVNYGTLSAELTTLKRTESLSWLNNASHASLQQALIDLQKAFNSFFAKRSNYPTFKKKGQKDSCRYTQTIGVDYNRSKIKVQKIGFIKCRGLREMSGQLKNITVFSKAGNWYEYRDCRCDLYEPEVPGL